MTLKDDDKPGTSQKYDKDVEANLALKDDIFFMILVTLLIRKLMTFLEIKTDV